MSKTQKQVTANRTITESSAVVLRRGAVPTDASAHSEKTGSPEAITKLPSEDAHPVDEQGRATAKGWLASFAKKIGQFLLHFP
jgi:hypothetical protein